MGTQLDICFHFWLVMSILVSPPGCTLFCCPLLPSICAASQPSWLDDFWEFLIGRPIAPNSWMHVKVFRCHTLFIKFPHRLLILMLLIHSGVRACIVCMVLLWRTGVSFLHWQVVFPALYDMLGGRDYGLERVRYCAWQDACLLLLCEIPASCGQIIVKLGNAFVESH